MKAFLVCLLLGVSVVATAAVVPEQSAPVPAPQRIPMRLTDRTKHKIMIEKKLEASKKDYSKGFMESEEAARLRQIEQLVTKENVTAVNNFVRLADQNPEGLLGRMLGAKPGEVVLQQRGATRLGSQKSARGATLAKESDDPLEMLTSIRMHDVTGTYDELEQGGEYIKQTYDTKVIPVLKNLGHEFLGQKSAPVLLPDVSASAMAKAVKSQK